MVLFGCCCSALVCVIDSCLFDRAALDRAAVLLKMSKEVGLKIDNLWGSGGGQRPVNQLIKEVQTLPTHTS